MLGTAFIPGVSSQLGRLQIGKHLCLVRSIKPSTHMQWLGSMWVD